MFRLQSAAFENGQEIAQKYGKRAENVSPPLAWVGAPDAVRSFALAIVDRHPVARNYVHWLVSEISPEVTALPEGAAGSSQLVGANELRPYAGPFPPSGTHDYEFTVYALDTETLGLPPMPTLEAFIQAVEPHRLASARLVGRFTRLGR